MASFEAPSQPLVSCHFGNLNLPALINTGSMVSFLSRDMLNNKPPKPIVDGVLQASLAFPGNVNIYSSRFLVSSKLFCPLQCVLGWDFLTSTGLALTREPSDASFLVGCHGKNPSLSKIRLLCPFLEMRVLVTV